MIAACIFAARGVRHRRSGGGSPRSAAAGIIIAGRTMAADDLAWTHHRNAASGLGPRRRARGSRLAHQRAGFGFGTGSERQGHDPVRARPDRDQRRQALAPRLGPSDRDRHGRSVRDPRRPGRSRRPGRLAQIAPPLNPGEFDYRAFLRAQGIRLRLTVDDPESFWRDPRRHRSCAYRAGSVTAGPGADAQLFERLDPSSRVRWPPPCSWASARRSSPRSTTPSHGPARLTCWPISGLQLQALGGCLLLVFRLVGLRSPAGLPGRRPDDDRLRRGGRAGPIGRAARP